jgi:hypothetical protein
MCFVIMNVYNLVEVVVGDLECSWVVWRSLVGLHRYYSVASTRRLILDCKHVERASSSIPAKCYIV